MVGLVLYDGIATANTGAPPSLPPVGGTQLVVFDGIAVTNTAPATGGGGPGHGDRGAQRR